MKLWFSALMRHFKKAPAFRADEGPAPETQVGSEVPNTAATIASAPESTDMKESARQQLIARIKFHVITLARRFRKTSALTADEGQQAGFGGRSEVTPEDGHQDEAPNARAMCSRRRLLIGGAVGLLILLLAGIVISIWPLFTQPQNEESALHHDKTAISSGTIHPASAPDISQPEIRAQKTENAELPSQTEMPKIDQLQQQPDVQPARLAAGSASSSPVGGEVMIDNKDPKAAAMSLKEAIEAMNANSRENKKKPAK